MKAGLICAAAALLAAGVGAAASAAAAVGEAAPLRVTGGTIAGKALPDGSTVYLGIPYAAPPLGSLRWLPPQAVVPWRGVRHTVAAPTPCAQLNEGWNTADAARSGEDCLYLSIHAPRHEAGARLPVLVWIHGGSNRAGSSYGIVDSPIYRQGIVAVGIEYRLGIFGFLSLRELTAQSPRDSSGNYGLLDQIAALQWVQRNITAFGGDPRNVTVLGQSAGAIDIGQLLISPLARGLFTKAIQESGSPGLPRTLAQNEAIGGQLFALNGLSPGAGGVAALRALPTRTLLADSTLMRAADNKNDALWAANTADGWVMPRAFQGFYGGWAAAAGVRLIIGNNTQEFIIDDPRAASGLIDSVFGRDAAGARRVYGYRGAQPPAADPILGTVGTQVLTDVAFRCVSNDEAAWVMAGGRKVWRYEFGVPQPGNTQVSHTAELGYVLGTRPAGATFGTWPPVQRYWQNFVKTGDPNGSGLPAWPDLGQQGAYMAFTPRGPKVGHRLRRPICGWVTDSLASWLRARRREPPLAGPDVCGVRFNPFDALLCKSAGSPSRK